MNELRETLEKLIDERVKESDCARASCAAYLLIDVLNYVNDNYRQGRELDLCSAPKRRLI